MSGELDVEGDLATGLSQIWGLVRRGALHTKARDRDAISHHYDLSNAFYQLVLDPSMAYSCGYFTSSSDTLAGPARGRRARDP